GHKPAIAFTQPDIARVEVMVNQSWGHAFEYAPAWHGILRHAQKRRSHRPAGDPGNPRPRELGESEPQVHGIGNRTRVEYRPKPWLRVRARPRSMQLRVSSQAGFD